MSAVVIEGFTPAELKRVAELRAAGELEFIKTKIQMQDGTEVRLGSLSQLVYHSIKATTKDGKVFSGDVTSFTDSVGSYSGFEEIDIEFPSAPKGGMIGTALSEDEIAEIIVME